MPCDRHQSNHAARGWRSRLAVALLAALASWAGAGAGTLHAQEEMDAGEVEIGEVETRAAAVAPGVETPAAARVPDVETGAAAAAPGVETPAAAVAPSVEAQEVEVVQVEEAPAATPPITVGGGLQSSFLHHQSRDADATEHLRVNSLRLYLNGAATDTIKFMVNTDIDYGGSLGAPNPGQNTRFKILDAVAQFEMSDTFNVWVGRFLPPSDRANLYGPFYAHHWGVYADGVQDGYPFIFQGRANGAAYWGQFDKVKVSAGAFDGHSTTGISSLIGAGRVQVNFWDQEPGYYLNSTYYGEKNILAIGLAGQTQAESGNAYSADFLMERKVAGGGAVSLEAEWARYDGLGGYDPRYVMNDGGYLLAAYLFPKRVGPGQFEILGKYARARFREGLTPDYNQKTTEVDLNYIIRQFNARLMIFFKDTSYTAVQTDDFQVGVGLQIQM